MHTTADFDRQTVRPGAGYDEPLAVGEFGARWGEMR